MPRSLLASESRKCPTFSCADRTGLRSAFGICTVCDRLSKLLARGILIDSHRCGDRKQPHEESGFHVIVRRSMDRIPANIS
jgi:hypothetical protein